jgi:PAP2 superfamily protein
VDFLNKSLDCSAKHRSVCFSIHGRMHNTLDFAKATTRKNIKGAIALIFILCCTSIAPADVVTEWNAIMQETAAVPPFPNLRTAAITQLAVFEAVNAITRDYKAYLGRITAQSGASREAAVIAAAHRALVALHPARAVELEALRARSLAAIPDSQAKIDGIAVGEAAANAILALRGGDGWDTVLPYVISNKPGEWKPTPPGFAPALFTGLSKVVPFGIENGAQFRLGPPPALYSKRYARDYNEVKRVGEVNSADRTKYRTDVARFYAVTDVLPLYNTAARQVSEAQGKTISENARIFALLNMAIFDGAIAVFDTKYFYNLWRPVTAIREGDRNKNRRTGPDPNWLPLIDTPPFPSYPSGHGGIGAAARRVLEEMFGEDGHTITLSNPLLPEVVLNYTSWKQIADDVSDARIYGGIHYRFDQEGGASLGSQVGEYILRHKLRLVNGHE